MAECILCCEILTEKTQLKLQCKHIFHKGCISKLIKLECPCCKTKLTELPKEIKDKIKINTGEYKEELLEEERQEILAEVGNVNALFLNSANLLLNMMRNMIENRRNGGGRGVVLGGANQNPLRIEPRVLDSEVYNNKVAELLFIEKFEKNQNLDDDVVKNSVHAALHEFSSELSCQEINVLIRKGIQTLS